MGRVVALIQKLAMSRPIRVRIFHQVDPGGPTLGGIVTFIRGIVDAAPDDIAVSLVGLTTDPVARPVGRWSTVQFGRGRIPFFAVGRDRSPRGRSRIPLSLKMAAGLWRYRRVCGAECDVLEFHRFETVLPLLCDSRPKSGFVHQHMQSLRDSRSDIKWRYAPWLYFALEQVAIPRFRTVYCVRSDAVEHYRVEFPKLAERFRFIPTWVDRAVFYERDACDRLSLREEFSREMCLAPDDELLLFVGRIDRQKDPLLLLESFAVALNQRPTLRLVIVGDGVLREAAVRRAAELAIESRVTFAGVRSPTAVSDLLQISSALLLTSSYEGMPMVVLEALGCGVPVVTTRVGEVARVVAQGENGSIVDERSPAAFAAAILELLAQGDACRGARCVRAIRDYVPDKVLIGVFENYRRLASRSQEPPPRRASARSAAAPR